MFRFFSSFLGISILVLGGFTFYFFNGIFSNSLEFEETSFVIEKGATPNEISFALEEKGVIESRFLFEAYSQIFKENKFIAGGHTIPANASLSEVVESLMTPGFTRETQKLTFIEGWTLEDMGVYLEKEEIMEAEAWTAYTKNPPASLIKEYPRLFTGFEEGMTLEGYVFPDTYEIFVGSTKEDILKKALDNFNRKLTDALLLDIERSGYSLREIVIMASIVEKEVRSPEEKANVADIFYKRLEDGMLFQADSTVNYVTKAGRARSTYTDIEIDNPYNTYKYIGLPPGPISNPGLSSFLAAVNPSPNPYYFFLTSKSGKVYYGKNFDEHRYNRRYLDD